MAALVSLVALAAVLGLVWVLVGSPIPDAEGDRARLACRKESR